MDGQAAQKTLKTEVTIEGRGVHSDAPVTMTLRPAPVDGGVAFRRIDLDGAPVIPVTIANISSDALTRQTTLALAGRPEVGVATVEHLLATFHGLEVDNCMVDIDGPEAPFFDGSAEIFCAAIADAGLVEQDRPRRFACLKEPVWINQGDIDIVALPAESLRLTFFIEFSEPLIGRQTLSLAITPEVFARDLAWARTFLMRREIEYLQSRGLIRGGSLDSALIVDGDHLYNAHLALKADDEFVRHKIMDLLGDLFVLGRPLRAHVIAVKSGHQTHAAFVARLHQALHGGPSHPGSPAGRPEDQ